MSTIWKPKWCSHCRKDDHNDSECWSTRAVTSHPASSILRGAPTWPPFPVAPMSNELKAALRRVGVNYWETP